VVRFLIVLALLFSVTPGMPELFETGAHLIVHADWPHHDEHGPADADCGEHSCTPLGHHCSCHVNMVAQESSRSSVATPFDTGHDLAPTCVATALGCVAEPPPLRPPIA
jgi:hypothetical protein